MWSKRTLSPCISVSCAHCKDSEFSMCSASCQTLKWNLNQRFLPDSFSWRRQRSSDKDMILPSLSVSSPLAAGLSYRCMCEEWFVFPSLFNVFFLIFCHICTVDLASNYSKCLLLSTLDSSMISVRVHIPNMTSAVDRKKTGLNGCVTVAALR